MGVEQLKQLKRLQKENGLSDVITSIIVDTPSSQCHPMGVCQLIKEIQNLNGATSQQRPLIGENHAVPTAEAHHPKEGGSSPPD